MKKYLLTMGVALLSLAASAQFMVTTTVNTPADGDSWGTENFTQEMGIGYIHKDIVVGIVKSGEDYDAFGRYALSCHAYVIGKMATDSTHSLSIGVGFSSASPRAFTLFLNFIRAFNELLLGILAFSIAL